MKVTPAAIVAVQDKRMVVDWFLLLKASPYFAVPLIRMGMSANAVTVLWGFINMVGAFLIYLTIRGNYLLLPLVALAFVVSEILDTSDGEIARFTGTSNPVGGKMLDGVAHKATEYALIAAYACGAAAVTQSPLALPIGFALMAAEAMGSYCYERRLLIIRVHMQSKEKISGERPAGHTYVERTSWWDLSWRHKLRTVAGLFSYKFAYAAIALALLAPAVFLWTLAALAVYKHVAWCRMVMQTLRLADRAVSA
jgi:phosphatidylglycerophosphate synthase